jgi:hypothetical protein
MAYRFSRYQNRKVFKNTDPSYIKQFSSRKIKSILQHGTAKFTWTADLRYEEEYWGVGFRFYKLADKYYGDPSLWWIIPWFNQKPLESDFDAGDIVMIPVPLEQILEIFREA